MGYAQSLRRRTGRMPQAPARAMGTWKLAYADFLTALVAFFLVMWLVKGLPEHERDGVAEYFRSSSIEVSSEPIAAKETTAQHLAGLLRESRKLSDWSETVRISATGDTIRIDLIDRLDEPLFQSYGTELTPAGIRLIETFAAVLAMGAWPVGIEGHTDAFAAVRPGMDNWDLSTARAHAARRALIDAGFAPERFASIAGLADTAPINPGEPHLAANRRVTLILQVPPEPRIS